MGAHHERLPRGDDARTPAVLPIRWIVLACVAAWIAVAALYAGSADAAPDLAPLTDRYAALQARMTASPFGRPLVVDSGETDGRMHGVIHGELAHPFAPMAARLATPTAWCEVIALHLNVKGCAADGATITVYSGRKFYEPVARAHAIRYALHVAESRPDYFKVVLAAADGPLATRDYEIVLEAMPLGTGTFVALRYAFRPSVASRLATASYLATAGSAKAGFTIVGRGGDGRPQWIGGVRGIVERNAMRNFLALDAWLATCDTPAADRFERTLARMAALTDQYPVQLVEMPAAEYVAIKRQEREDAVERARVASR